MHVPSAYLSMMTYMVMAVSAGIGLIWRIKLSHAVAAAAAPLGAWFTFLALATGMIWGRPMWGTWWEWGDPRMMSELILLFLYFGYMALQGRDRRHGKGGQGQRHPCDGRGGQRSDHPLFGGVVDLAAPGSDPRCARAGRRSKLLMLYPLLAMIFGFTFLFGALILGRIRTEVLLRERRKRWVREIVMPEGGQG